MKKILLKLETSEFEANFWTRQRKKGINYFNQSITREYKCAINFALSLLCDKNKHLKIVLKTWLNIQSAKEKKLNENNNYKDTKS